MATNACDEFEAYLPGGAGANVQNLVRGFSNSNNWVTVNVGQIKAVAAPFYARLIAEGYTNAYPWTGISTTNDYALANLGQLKNLFSFEISVDSDADGLADWWEMRWFGNLNQIGSGDFDSDGFINSVEYAQGTNPTSADSDADGLTDQQEINVYGTNPNNPDSDGDGINDGAEVNNRTDPNNNDTTAPVITIDWPVQNRAWKIVP